MEILLILESASDFTRSAERVFMKHFFQDGEGYDGLDH
jgi:hypothetical protein